MGVAAGNGFEAAPVMAPTLPALSFWSFLQRKKKAGFPRPASHNAFHMSSSHVKARCGSLEPELRSYAEFSLVVGRDVDALLNKEVAEVYRGEGARDMGGAHPLV